MMAYNRIYAAMKTIQAESIFSRPAQRIRYEQNNTCTALGFVGTEFELFAAFDSRVLKREALEVCQKLAAWVKANQAMLFAPV